MGFISFGKMEWISEIATQKHSGALKKIAEATASSVVPSPQDSRDTPKKEKRLHWESTVFLFLLTRHRQDRPLGHTGICQHWCWLDLQLYGPFMLISITVFSPVFLPTLPGASCPWTGTSRSKGNLRRFGQIHALKRTQETRLAAFDLMSAKQVKLRCL